MPRIDADLKLDFKDVLLRPKRSSLKSRAEVGAIGMPPSGWRGGIGCQGGTGCLICAGGRGVTPSPLSEIGEGRSVFSYTWIVFMVSDKGA